MINTSRRETEGDRYRDGPSLDCIFVHVRTGTTDGHGDGRGNDDGKPGTGKHQALEQERGRDQEQEQEQGPEEQQGKQTGGRGEEAFGD